MHMGNKEMNDQTSFEGFMDLGVRNDIAPIDLKDRRCIAFASFGNDSIALIQWLYDHDFSDVTVIFNDTGHAADFWQERIYDGMLLCEKYDFNYDDTQSIGMKDLIRKKKSFPPNGEMQWCTETLKIIPTWLWLQENDGDKEALCVTGIRRQESQNRKNAPIFLQHSPNHQGRNLYSPLATVEEAERDELIIKAGFEVLPHSSMECSPCYPNANKSDILMLTEEEIADIEALEKEMGFTKTSWRTGKKNPRTAFRPARVGGALGIRDVVRWAKGEKFKPDPSYDPDGEEAQRAKELDDGCQTGFCGI